MRTLAFQGWLSAGFPLPAHSSLDILHPPGPLFDRKSRLLIVDTGVSSSLPHAFLGVARRRIVVRKAIKIQGRAG